MSLVIFFGMAACIFILGVIVISVTIYQWIQLYKTNKATAALANQNNINKT